MQDDFATVGRLLKDSRRILFITGAGVSAESQIPTFRGVAAAFADGMTEEGMPFEEVLSGPTFSRNSELSWKYFFLLERCMRGKEPNAAHHAMAALQTPQRQICIATQNIDGLHQRAGSAAVLELHGNLRRIICPRCEYSAIMETFEALAKLPRCLECNAILRPDIVLYEEPLAHPVLEAFDRAQDERFDLVFSVGTTSLFHYVTQPVLFAGRQGIPVVEINPERTPVSDLADFRFAGTAGNIMQQLMQEMGA